MLQWLAYWASPPPTACCPSPRYVCISAMRTYMNAARVCGSHLRHGTARHDCREGMCLPPHDRSRECSAAALHTPRLVWMHRCTCVLSLMFVRRWLAASGPSVTVVLYANIWEHIMFAFDEFTRCCARACYVCNACGVRACFLTNPHIASMQMSTRTACRPCFRHFSVLQVWQPSLF
jgi:hypothetical protein